MRGVEQSLGRVGKAAEAGSLSTGRLGNQFANLAGRIAHLNPIVGNLASVLGDFAVGGLVTAGVLGGLALIAVAYDQLTSSSRKAMEQADKLTDALLRTARIRALGVGGESKAAIADLAEGGAQRQKRAGFLLGAAGVMPGLAPILEFLAGKDIAQAGKNATAGKEAVNQYGLAVAEANEKLVAAAEALAAKEKAASDRRLTAKEREAAKLLAIDQRLLDFKRKQTIDELHKIAALYAEIFGQATFQGMPNIAMPFEGLTEKQKQNLIELGVIKDDANKNAYDTQQAIWGAAIQSANIVAGALNIGGSGRGSGIGGAIGGALGGAALGGKLGAFGGPIGSVVGAIAGSFIGGLFDHKKAVETNTAAVRQNTAALLLNSPSGYKTASGRFDATDVKDFRRALQRNATRGGAPILVTP